MKKTVLECDLCKKQFPDTEFSEANLLQDTGVHVCPDCKYIYFEMHKTIEKGLRATFSHINDAIYMLTHFIVAIDWTNPDTRKHFGDVAQDIQKFKEELLNKNPEDGNVKTE